MVIEVRSFYFTGEHGRSVTVELEAYGTLGDLVRVTF
jgi:hypothetical protein